MKTILWLFALLIIMGGMFSCSGAAKLKKLQANYIPSEISNIYIGMSAKDLKEARGINNLSVIPAQNLTIIKEESTKDSISMFQYQFGKDNRLYEIIIEYVPEYVTKDACIIKYGAPNNGKEWLFPIGKKKLKVWVYQNRLCIADNSHFSK